MFASGLQNGLMAGVRSRETLGDAALGWAAYGLDVNSATLIVTGTGLGQREEGHWVDAAAAQTLR